MLFGGPYHWIFPVPYAGAMNVGPHGDRLQSAAGADYLPDVVVTTPTAKLCVATLPAGQHTPITVTLPSTAPYAPGAQLQVGLLLGRRPGWR